MKVFLRIIVLVLPFTLHLVAYGQNEHPIELKLKECHANDSNWTTYGMTQCELTALKEWDDELNRIYKELMGLLSDNQKEMLIDSQRKWIEFRDLELKFKSQVYTDLEGTMWTIAKASSARQLTKNRTDELSGLLIDLKAGK